MGGSGLEGGADSVREIVEKAAYMVLGLGDVYLGAPCAVPVDPRCALPESSSPPASFATARMSPEVAAQAGHPLPLAVAPSVSQPLSLSALFSSKHYSVHALAVVPK